MEKSEIRAMVREIVEEAVKPKAFNTNETGYLSPQSIMQDIANNKEKVISSVSQVVRNKGRAAAMVDEILESGTYIVDAVERHFRNPHKYLILKPLQS